MTTRRIERPRIVAAEDWLRARKELLAQEKELTRQRDEVDRQRRDLPWTKVEKNYLFDRCGRERNAGRPFWQPDSAHRLAFHVRSRLEGGMCRVLVSVGPRRRRTRSLGTS